ncbi:MAG TPA: M20/M25/M40 family metallo-hydrolase [Candidatus Binataceae bacterium]|nr:M20/M25/M40 family metallo-hydrolase [Candidatus Binataceae bacterium]
MDTALLEWCRRLIACRSVTAEGTRRIAELCAREMLAPAGVAARLIPSTREGDEQVNLIAAVRGRDPSLRPIVLNTHLDTVPPGAPQLWTACDGDPFAARVDGDRIYGLGAADTKLDFAAKVFALTTVGTPRRDVYLAGSFGEEHGLTGAKEIVEAATLSAGAMAFVGEPSRLEVVTAHKGLMVFELKLGFKPLRVDEAMQARRLTFAGRAAHSSTPALGINAIEVALAAMAISFKLNLAAISGGTAVNVVPARCDVVAATEAALDLPIGGAIEVADFGGPVAEIIPLEAVITTTRFIAALRKYADGGGGLESGYAAPTLTCNPGVIRSASGSMTLEFELRPPPGLALDQVRAGVARVTEEISRDAVGVSVALGERRANPGFRAAAASETVEIAMGALAGAGLALNSGVKSGCTEAGIYAAAGLDPVVIGPGPSTGVIHAPNEYNFLSDVEAAVRFYRALLEM